MFLHLILPVAQAGVTLAAVVSSRAAPTVTLDSATVTGAASGNVSKFLGIPFGQPPTGNLRFQLPAAVGAYTGTIDATAFGPSCPQQAVKLPVLTGLPQETVDYVVNSIFSDVLPSDEDCLTLNVVKPASATDTSQLPVAVWFFGGGFELGGTSMYDGSSIVQRSIALGEPVIYVSMNYRVSAFGFLAGKEVKEAGVGNLGLHDQRLALKWIQKYVTAFGGDPDKVTIWGESAGAMSVASHMIINDGDTEGLFRGAFMQSGSPLPVGDIENGQKDYDDIVDKTGCSGSSDTLACLRTVSYDVLKAAVDDSPFIFAYQSLRLAWLPRTDGVLFSDNPQRLVQQGKVANIPFVTGDCDDEGTLFSLSQLNVTTDAQAKEYLQTILLPNAPEADIDSLMDLYPQNPAVGSPFDTGLLNIVSPQFKRFAALQGDAVFQAPRRFFINVLSGKQDIYTFINKRLKSVPVLGSFHASDILNIYFGGDMVDYLIRFVNDLNPNGNTGITWPKWTAASPAMLSFNDGLIPLSLTTDTFRQEAIDGLNEILLENPI
ncbi:carotenoid ester lipase precursor [Hymenopellis radicata]|nr:carotenoid ester lipase precursor [Hymenopellis radicata]